MADASPNGIAPTPHQGTRSNGIEAHGLAREFKGGVRAVDGIDIEVRPGEIYGFLGPNGAGKSTTVHMLTTLLPPTAGSARVAGFDVLTQGAQVRDAIGAALQEAALDPQLSAREHMRLQGALHGLSKAERTKRGDELIERVGLTDAADRKVGGYSGGMKRRLDLALALLHGPSVLFLDEPTTGLDIQSRTALWDEVASLSRDEGMTVFLTTQYLEEADQLAERVGIIDHGKIVAEGTPAALKAEVGRPTVEAVPADIAQRERAAAVLDRFGELVPGTPNGAAVRLDDGPEELAAIVRAFDEEGLVIANLELHAPSLNDVFLAKTGRSLEGAAAEEAEEPREPGRGARGRGRAGVSAATVPARVPLATGRSVPLRIQIGELARRSIVRTLRQPAAIIPATVFPLILLAINAAGLDSATSLPGFPTDSYITFALAFAFLQAGVFAVIGTGQNLAEDRENGFFNRLQLTPIRAPALVAGQLAGTLVLGLFQAATYIGIGLAAGGDDRGRLPRGPGAGRALGRDHARLRLDRPVRRHARAARPRRSRACSR